MYVVLEKNIVEIHHCQPHMPSLPLLAVPFSLVFSQHRAYFQETLLPASGHLVAGVQARSSWAGQAELGAGSSVRAQHPKCWTRTRVQPGCPASSSGRQGQRLGYQQGYSIDPGLDTSTTTSPSLGKALTARGWAGPWGAGRGCHGRLVRGINQVLAWGSPVPAVARLCS